MLWSTAVIFTLLWALAMVTGHTMDGYIHVLIVVAVGLLLLRIAKGPRRRAKK